jgi:hypothetical protein
MDLLLDLLCFPAVLEYRTGRTFMVFFFALPCSSCCVCRPSDVHTLATAHAGASGDHSKHPGSTAMSSWL